MPIRDVQITGLMFLEEALKPGQQGLITVEIPGSTAVRPVAWGGFEGAPAAFWSELGEGPTASALEREEADTGSHQDGFFLAVPCLTAPRAVICVRGPQPLEESRAAVQTSVDTVLSPLVARLDCAALSRQEDDLPLYLPYPLARVGARLANGARAFLEGLRAEFGDLGYLRSMIVLSDPEGNNYRLLARHNWKFGPRPAQIKSAADFQQMLMRKVVFSPELMAQALKTGAVQQVHPHPHLSAAFTYWTPAHVLCLPIQSGVGLLGFLYLDRPCESFKDIQPPAPLNRIQELVASSLAPLLGGKPATCSIKALTSEDADTVVTALLQVGPGPPPETEAILDCLTRADARIRLHAVRALACGTGPRPDPLWELVQDPVPEVRREVVATLARRGDCPALLNVIGIEHADLVAAAVQALAGMGPAALPGLREILGDPEDRRCPATLQVLQAMGRPAAAAAPDLPRHWQPDRPEATAVLALDAARNLGVWLDLLIPALEDSRLAIRLAAARAVGSVRPVPEPAVLALESRLDDSDSQVREAAGASLGELGKLARPAIASLVGKLGEPGRRQDGWRVYRTALNRIVQPYQDCYEADYWMNPAPPQASASPLKLAGTLGPIGGSSRALALAAGGRLLVLIGRDRGLQLWNLAARHYLGVLDAEPYLEPQAVGMNGNGQAVSLHSGGGQGYRLRVWDLASRTCVRDLIGPEGFPRDLAVCGTRALVSTRRHGLTTTWAVDLWDLSAGRIARQLSLEGGDRRVSLAGSQGLLYGGHGAILRVDLDSSRDLPWTGVERVAAAVLGHSWALVASEEVRVFDPHGHCRMSFPEPGVQHLALMPGERYAVGLGKRLVVWDLQQGRQAAAIEGVGCGGESSLAVSPSVVAVGGRQGTSVWTPNGWGTT